MKLMDSNAHSEGELRGEQAGEKMVEGRGKESYERVFRLAPSSNTCHRVPAVWLSLTARSSVLPFNILSRHFSYLPSLKSRRPSNQSVSR